MRLIVMRHAKSAWSVDADDLERPLSRRGRGNLTTAAPLLAELAPQVVLASPARRCVETVAVLRKRGLEVPARKVAALYGEDVEQMLTEIRQGARKASCALVVGHYPSVVELTTAAAEPTGDDAWDRLQEKFPTSAFAVVEGDGDWSELGDGGAPLTRFDVPR